MARTPLHFMRVAVVAIAAGLLAPVSGALAQDTQSRMSGLALSADEPIQIESDLLKINDEASQATFTGNVKVLHPDRHSGSRKFQHGQRGAGTDR
jgi:lipopolysaccharide export system protein LptA